MSDQKTNKNKVEISKLPDNNLTNLISIENFNPSDIKTKLER